MNLSRRTALVTGGTGFLGGHLSRRLLREGWEVTALGRNAIAGHALEKEGARFLLADLADADASTRACRGIDVVFHCAARSSPWGRYADFYRDNTLATRHIVSGCLREKVSRLVYVSTPSLYFEFQDELNISESRPLPACPANHYVQTKILAELEVDAAAAELQVITLRPRALFGPGDTSLFPRILRANGPRGFPLIGDEDPMMDITCVENVVDALMLSADAPPSASGKKFNITNGEPWKRSHLLAELFKETGICFHPRKVSYNVAYRLAMALEHASNLLTLGRWEPPLTRYSVGVLAKSQTLNISAARLILGYSPRKTISEGLRDYGAWWKEAHRAT